MLHLPLKFCKFQNIVRNYNVKKNPKILKIAINVSDKGKLGSGIVQIY